jgi:kynurenine formamidase
MQRSDYIEMNHVIEHGMVTYRGLPGSVIRDYWTRKFSSRFYQEGTSFQIGKLEMIIKTGICLDTPYYKFEKGDDFGDIPTDRIADFHAIVIRASQKLINEKSQYLKIEINLI